uniref:Complement C3-like n=1 Tax=Sparus aurata TaxID=8175 RepID=A0A671YQE7_SPAAU
IIEKLLLKSFVMSAPNLLRVGTAENIFVECQDYRGDDISVEIIVMNHPTKAKRLASTTVTLNSSNNFQELAQIKIPVGDFSKDPSIKQYVYLQAQFPDRLLEKVVLVSFQSGYIFIQTDKTLYTPESTGEFNTPSVLKNTPSTTPEGIILPSDAVTLKSGIHSGSYKLAEIVSPGLWKVVARLDSNPQQSYSAEFEVKEYVLPSFEVKLTPVSPFFYVDSPELTVDIRATYLFGEEVDGMAYVVFGVIKDGKMSFPSSIQRVEIKQGNGNATLKREHITQTFPEILSLVGSPIFVAVSVLTESGSEMVEAELRAIQIVTSPYTIHFKKTPKYFKPGMSFDVAVEVVNPDETPAQGVAVVVDPGLVKGVTEANGMARITINTVETSGQLQITAKTSDPHITLERQASATMTALPHTTKSNNYIHIGEEQPEIISDGNISGDGLGSILSRGRLVKSGRYTSKAQVLISMIEIVTKEMLPSFRIIAFYHTDDNEVVSDSVWVDVKDSCMGSLKLDSSRPANSYEPRKMFGLKVTGNPGATVGLVAVDKGVYVLNNKHRLTQKKVWDIVEKSDTGCTPGGGRDAMSVFFDAGLLFVSSTTYGTPYRLEFKCPAPSRRKRTTIMEVTTSLVSKYQVQLQRDCCLDGMKKTPVSYSCERRSDYIVNGAACKEAFLYCCKVMENQQDEWKEDSLKLARADQEDNSYMDSSEIVSRTKFPESWLWSDIKLDTTTLQKNVPLQDSITTWQFTGISLSRTHGICVGEPLEVIVRKEFFIDLRLPYSAVRGEQIEVRAILHNYSPDPITVRVDLIETPHVCSSASRRGKYRQEVKVGPQTTRSVPFIIIPMKDEEDYPIEVKAAVKDSSLYDGVMRKLNLETLCVHHLLSDPPTFPLFLSVGGVQEVIINSRIPKKDMAPNTPSTTQIFATGEISLSALVENAISGQSMGTLIQKPYGCGEQNMAAMTLPVIAATYLDKTNQWEAVGFEKRAEALQHIKTGYQNQLPYRKDDGSFAVFRDSKSSTWLTAYVAKVFAMGNSLVAAQKNLICDAVKYLTLNAQRPDGMFTEDGYVFSSSMRGDVEGRDSDASMTAFCLIAMQESHTLCNKSVTGLQRSIDKAVAYLETRLPRLTYSYAVAMTSYALANANKLDRTILYKFASPDSSHWPVPYSNLYTLEATAYALLALVKVKAFEDAKPVVRWFNEQLKVGGGYGSTQATIMVYQAVAEYWANAEEPQYDLKLDILLPTKSDPEKYIFNRGNHYINDINQNVKVTANGTGEATVTYILMFFDCPALHVSDCVDKVHDASMSILDIGLLTGFNVDTNDLKLLSEGHARIIAKYEINKALSKKGSLIIYLDKVSNTQKEEITFKIHQKFKVGVLQPAAVSVYEYYDQTPCVKFYHPERRAGQLMRLCRGDECTCAEGKQDDGSFDVVDVNNNITFLSYQHCRESLDLKKGKTYLVMGTSRDMFQYILGERTWIEYWPTNAECQNVNYRPTCLGMEDLEEVVKIFGCQAK